MGAHFKLLPAILILVGGAENGDDLLLGGKRDGAGYPGARPPGRIHDLLGALVDQVVLVGLELDADLLVCHIISSSFKVSGSTRFRVFHL